MYLLKIKHWREVLHQLLVVMLYLKTLGHDLVAEQQHQNYDGDCITLSERIEFEYCIFSWLESIVYINLLSKKKLHRMA